MAASATATKPAKVRTSKQPPQNSVWIRYHPWIEGVMAHISAWSIHLLVIGGAVLWFTYLAYALGFAKPPRSLPMEVVQLDPGAGNGRPAAPGADKPGSQAAPKEGAASDTEQKPTTQAAPADRVKLNEAQAAKVDVEFTPEAQRYIHEGPQSMEAFVNLDRVARDKMLAGLKAPSKGDSGPKTDGGAGTGPEKGTGPGAGDGVGTGAGRQAITEREKRMLRWTMRFDTKHGGANYLQQLEAIGAIVAIPVGPNNYRIVDLAKRPLKMEDRDLSTIQRIWWTDENPNSVASLMTEMGLRILPPKVVAFIPQELEDELAKKELAKGLKVDEIFETTFGVKVPGLGGRKYDVWVADQKRK